MDSIINHSKKISLQVVIMRKIGNGFLQTKK